MFWSGRHHGSSTLLAGARERAGAAVRLIGAFFTLADDYDAEWEFPVSRAGGGSPATTTASHRARASTQPEPARTSRTAEPSLRARCRAARAHRRR